ncbi:hypothetical protein RCL_jg26370.t1 [Rhizophagus clarus]|uniref:Uncharacterized protein n=1 Tax=Rhizophagus clarus TaxID=94130 RepID=A0A8H3KYZ2_9GLOM|nr:hypothetical protein RCL_jg26370.t1 [Rhizophagus clarus]
MLKIFIIFIHKSTIYYLVWEVNNECLKVKRLRRYFYNYNSDRIDFFGYEFQCSKVLEILINGVKRLISRGPRLNSRITKRLHIDCDQSYSCDEILIPGNNNNNIPLINNLIPDDND